MRCEMIASFLFKIQGKWFSGHSVGFWGAFGLVFWAGAIFARWDGCACEYV